MLQSTTFTYGSERKIGSMMYKIDTKTGRTWIVYPSGEVVETNSPQ